MRFGTAKGDGQGNTNVKHVNLLPLAMQHPDETTFLSNPLSLVESILQVKLASGASDIDSDWGLASYFAKLSISDATVPSLNVTEMATVPRKNQMVRFRGMIQDIFNPEYYLGLYELRNKRTGETVVRSGKYLDVLDTPDDVDVITDSNMSRTFERQPLYCVPVPCESPWVTEVYRTNEAKPAAAGKSSTEAVDEMDQDLPSRPRNKRSRDAADDGHSSKDSDVDMADGDDEGGAATAANSSAKRRAAPQESSALGAPDASQTRKAGAVPDLNLPGFNGAGTQGSLPVIVKIYDTPTETFKINDVWEFVGILAKSRPDIPVAGQEGLEDEMELANQPRIDADFIPRLHCVKCRKLSSHNPLIPLDPTSASLQLQHTVASAKDLRGMIVQWLSPVLGGDQLAVEYLLCNMLSRIYSRPSEVDLVGSFPLNFSHVPVVDNWPKKVHYLVSGFLSKAYLMPLTREMLMNSNLLPYKDYEEDRLVAGVLQLADGTHLMVDETKLEAGQLEPKAYKQLMSLGALIQNQRAAYDFKYHTVDFVTDYPTLVVSTGRSLFKSTVHLPMECKIEPDLPQLPVSAEFINSARVYFTLMRSHLPFQDSSAEVAKIMEDEFIRLRKLDANTSVDRFRTALTMARLYALSRGENRVTKEIWEAVAALEDQRIARVNALPKPTPNASPASVATSSAATK